MNYDLLFLVVSGRVVRGNAGEQPKLLECFLKTSASE
jgi:hypothetical protein